MTRSLLWFLLVAVALQICQAGLGGPSVLRAHVKVNHDNGVFKITGDTPWLVEQFPISPIDLALRDVREDFYRVFGLPPNMIYDGAQLDSFKGSIIVLGASDHVKTVLGESEFSSLFGSVVKATESHACKAWSRGLACTGQGDLGAVYGAYLFSHDVLKVDPSGYWTELDPPEADELPLSATYSKVVKSPLFSYRGFFINDEDLLTGFQRDPAAASPMSLELANAVFGTILRNGGNTVIAGTATYPDEAIIELVDRRGLHVAQHHITLLGLNTFQYPAGLSYSYAVNPEMQKHAWGVCVDALKDRKMLWSVGYRGLNDYPFWNDDPVFNTDVKRGALISEVMAEQMKIVSAHTGDASPKALTFLWDEMADLYAKNTLEVPKNVVKVFADGGEGIVQNKDLLQEGDGVYYHVAMEGGDRNQLTEMVPPSRVFSEVGALVAKKATSAFILNTSDILPVVLSMTAAMRFVWDPEEYLEGGDTAAAQTKFLQQWALDKFGVCSASDKIVPGVVDFWNKYYNVPFIVKLKGEQYISSRIRALATGLADYVRKVSTTIPLDDARKDTAFFQDSVDYVKGLAKSAGDLCRQVASGCGKDRASYCNAHILHHIEVQYHALNSLFEVIAAIEATAKHDEAGATAHSDVAVKEISMLVRNYRVLGRDTKRFPLFYMNDELTNFFNILDVVKSLSSALHSSGTEEEEPLVRFFRFGNGVWSTWYTYENTTNPHAPHNYPLFFKSEATMDHAVRILCANNTGGCTQKPTGGQVEPKQSYYVTLQTPAEGSTIRYTIDDSDPSSSSTVYSGPFELTGAANVTARAFGKDGKPSVEPASRAEFRLVQSTARGDGHVHR